MKIATCSTFALVVILFGVGAFLFFRESQFLARAETVTGRVENFRISDGENGGTSYCTLVSYTTLEGETFTHDTHFCNARPAYEIGDEVEVLYDPTNPERAQLNKFWNKYIGPVILTGVAGFLLVGTFGMMLLTRFVQGVVKQSA